MARHDAVSRSAQLNHKLIAFAKHSGFRPCACAPYRARTNAIVDRARARGDPGRLHGPVHHGDDVVAGLTKAQGERRPDEKLLALASQSC